jgi:hypothetical protein
MHEFEGLLFSECEKFADAINRIDMKVRFAAIRANFPTPEDINDSEITAPSKRVQNLVPEYEKPLFGVLAALSIGLDGIRKECPHFGAWVASLEGPTSIVDCCCFKLDATYRYRGLLLFAASSCISGQGRVKLRTASSR